MAGDEPARIRYRYGTERAATGGKNNDENTTVAGCEKKEQRALARCEDCFG